MDFYDVSGRIACNSFVLDYLSYVFNFLMLTLFVSLG